MNVNGIYNVLCVLFLNSVDWKSEYCDFIFMVIYTLSYHPKQSTSFNIFLNIGSLIGTTNLNLLPLIWYLHRLFMDHHHSFSQFKKWVIKWNHQQFERFPDSVKKILRNFLIHCQCTYVKAFMSGFTIIACYQNKIFETM